MGYIYVLTNESMPGLVKIGLTERKPEERAKELNSTGVPMPFEVAAYWRVDSDLRYMETRCHHLLSSFRVSQNREFFKITVDEVISILSPHFRTEEEIVLEKIRAQKKLDAEKHQREQIRQQRLKDEKRRQKEQLEQKIEYLSVSINRLNSDVSKIEALLSKPESITSRFLSKVQDGLIFILIVFCARVAPFALAILGLLSGEEFIQKLLLAAGFYVVGIFATMLFSAISIAVISLIERLRSYIFGESHNQLREMLSEKANELNNKSIELSRLKS